MKTKGLSQEGLKLIACVTMLIDHVGATLVYEMFYTAASAGANAGQILQLYEVLRTVGRLAFPIYCFLLAEGAHHTGNPSRYAIRLLLAAVFSEITFDLTFYGSIVWGHQNVMVTLFLGFCALEVMKRHSHLMMKIITVVPFALLADILHADYGADGVLLIALFGITRELPNKLLIQFLGMWFIFSPSHAMFLNWLGGFRVVLQEWAILALIPISLYDGRKLIGNKAVQWAFYLFYPVHIAVLALLEILIFG